TTTENYTLSLHDALPIYEGQGQALRPGLRALDQRSEQLVLPAGVDVGRDGGAERREDGRAREQEHGGGGEVQQRPLEGRLRRGRPGVGRLHQQPRVPVVRDLADRQRALHLRRRAAEVPRRLQGD